MSDKADELLRSGRVTITLLSPWRVAAKVSGSGGDYETSVEITQDGYFAHCTCENGRHHPGRAACYHVEAVERYWKATAPDPKWEVVKRSILRE